MEGEVSTSKYIYERKTSVRPISRHYEEEGEKPYIKYGCPVCESLGNHHQVEKGADKCYSCNVNLTWIDVM